MNQNMKQNNCIDLKLLELKYVQEFNFWKKVSIIQNIFIAWKNQDRIKKVITSLTVNNIRVHSTDDILNEEVKFYETLYTSNNTHINTHAFLEEIELERTLNDTSANICEGPITIEECKIATDEMKLNKSPGLDGLPVEFYTAFWDKIGNIVTSSLNEGFEKGELSQHPKQSTFSLLFKKGDPENI